MIFWIAVLTLYGLLVLTVGCALILSSRISRMEERRVGAIWPKEEE